MSDIDVNSLSKNSSQSDREQNDPIIASKNEKTEYSTFGDESKEVKI